MGKKMGIHKGIAAMLFAVSIVTTISFVVTSTASSEVHSAIPELEINNLYAVDPTHHIKRLISICTQTAQVETVITLLGPKINSAALAFSPNGELIGVDNNREMLYRIDIATGQIIHIGSPNPFLKGVAGLAFDREENLYGLNTHYDVLLSIDPTTGATTVIGSLGVDIMHTGLAINFQTNELYAVMDGRDGIPDKLLRINKETGEATVIGPLEVDLHAVGVEFNPVTGELFTLRKYNILMKIDVNTGKATKVGILEGVWTCNLAALWPPVLLPATIDFDPDTLNLNSRGGWVTVYIELPESCDVSNIDVGTVMLNDQVSAESRPTEVGDYDDDGVPDLMVKFDRAAVQDILEVGDEVIITVTGEVAGILFEGSDTIRVIDRGR